MMLVWAGSSSCLAVQGLAAVKITVEIILTPPRLPTMPGPPLSRGIKNLLTSRKIQIQSFENFKMFLRSFLSLQSESNNYPFKLKYIIDHFGRQRFLYFFSVYFSVWISNIFHRLYNLEQYFGFSSLVCSQSARHFSINLQNRDQRLSPNKSNFQNSLYNGIMGLAQVRHFNASFIFL